MTTSLTPTAARPAQSLSEFFDGVFGPTYSAFNGSGTQTCDGLPTNVYELGDTYQLAMLIPGIDPQSIQVTALANTISVAGSMQLSTPEGAKAVWEEFSPTQFRRQVGLPVELDPAGIEATYRDGVLVVTAPKAEHAKPRQIQVKV